MVLWNASLFMGWAGKDISLFLFCLDIYLGATGECPVGATERMSDLEHLSCEERLWELGLVSVGKGRLRGFSNPHKYPSIKQISH